MPWWPKEAPDASRKQAIDLQAAILTLLRELEALITWQRLILMHY
jgi:hypothetical protein